MVRPNIHRFAENVENNHPNLPIQYDSRRHGYVAIRIPKGPLHDENVRQLAGLVGGHKLAVGKIADGIRWTEYWVTSVHDTSRFDVENQGEVWRKPIR